MTIIDIVILGAFIAPFFFVKILYIKIDNIGILSYYL